MEKEDDDVTWPKSAQGISRANSNDKRQVEFNGNNYAGSDLCGKVRAR